jgi:hypothetical protein
MAETATVKIMPLLVWPPTVTVTSPVVAPLGTGATTLVALQLVGVAAAPLNLTVLVPCVVPKFVPVIVTGVPTRPEVTERLVMLGAGGGTVTVNVTPLLLWPPTVAVTVPVVAPLGTAVTILVALQLAAVAGVPLNATALVPCVVPRFVPVIVTGVPTGPELTERLVMPGAEGGGLGAITFCWEAQPSMPSTTRHKTPAGNGIEVRAGPAFDRWDVT